MIDWFYVLVLRGEAELVRYQGRWGLELPFDLHHNPPRIWLSSTHLSSTYIPYFVNRIAHFFRLILSTRVSTFLRNKHYKMEHVAVVEPLAQPPTRWTNKFSFFDLISEFKDGGFVPQKPGRRAGQDIPVSGTGGSTLMQTGKIYTAGLQKPRKVGV